MTTFRLATILLVLGLGGCVVEDGVANVTLRIDPYLWFQTNGLILDPFNQTGPIENLITSSFAEAFRDNDRNGDPD